MSGSIPVSSALCKEELHALASPLSNDARVLYVLGLRPYAQASTGTTSPINYRALLCLLDKSGSHYRRGRQINSLLRELMQVQLVELVVETDISRSLNGRSLILPRFPVTLSSSDPLYEDKFPLTIDWQPQEDIYTDVCKLIGLVDNHYEKPSLGEFIAYWIGKPEKRLSAYQWTLKFAQNQKRLMSASTTTESVLIGSQITKQTTSYVEADDNARQLVAKYHDKQKHKPA